MIRSYDQICYLSQYLNITLCMLSDFSMLKWPLLIFSNTTITKKNQEYQQSAAEYRSSFAQHFVELNLGSNFMKMLSADYKNRYSREHIEYLTDFLTSLILKLHTL